MQFALLEAILGLGQYAWEHIRAGIQHYDFIAFGKGFLVGIIFGIAMALFISCLLLADLISEFTTAEAPQNTILTPN